MYKKIKPVLQTMDSLADSCGLFTSDTELNNGYGCRSKSNEKSEPKCCYGWDCPLAVTADLKSANELDRALYEEYLPDYLKIEAKNRGKEEDFEIDGWLVQYREI